MSSVEWRPSNNVHERHVRQTNKIEGKVYWFIKQLLGFEPWYAHCNSTLSYSIVHPFYFFQFGCLENNEDVNIPI